MITVFYLTECCSQPLKDHNCLRSYMCIVPLYLIRAILFAGTRMESVSMEMLLKINGD